MNTPARISDTGAYQQFGNSVVVPVIAEVARIMVPHVIGMADIISKDQG